MLISGKPNFSTTTANSKTTNSKDPRINAWQHAGVGKKSMTILQHTTRRHNTNDINMDAFRECKAQWQRRHDAALRLEPLAHRPGDDRGFNPYWSN